MELSRGGTSSSGALRHVLDVTVQANTVGRVLPSAAPRPANIERWRGEEDGARLERPSILANALVGFATAFAPTTVPSTTRSSTVAPVSMVA